MPQFHSFLRIEIEIGAENNLQDSSEARVLLLPSGSQVLLLPSLSRLCLRCLFSRFIRRKGNRVPKWDTCMMSALGRPGEKL